MSSDEEVTKCFICEQDFEESATDIEQKRGLITFISASERRQDGKDNFLRGCESVRVHQKCRKLYTNEKMIRAAAKARSATLIEREPSGSDSQSGNIEFDFTTRCFFCTAEISKEFLLKEAKKPRENRNIVYKIRDSNRKQGIIVAARYHREDPWSDEVRYIYLG